MGVVKETRGVSLLVMELVATFRGLEVGLEGRGLRMIRRWRRRRHGSAVPVTVAAAVHRVEEKDGDQSSSIRSWQSRFPNPTLSLFLSPPFLRIFPSLSQSLGSGRSIR